MKQYTNKNKIIEAFIVEPYQNSGDAWDLSSSHGWQAVLIVGYSVDGYPNKITVDKEDEISCMKFLDSLELTKIID